MAGYTVRPRAWQQIYQSTRYGAEIVSVMHGTRDIQSLFEKT